MVRRLGPWTMKTGIDAVLGGDDSAAPATGRGYGCWSSIDCADQSKTRPVQTIPGPKDAAKIGPRESRSFSACLSSAMLNATPQVDEPRLPQCFATSGTLSDGKFARAIKVSSKRGLG